MSYLKLHIIFSLNFVSLRSVMRDKSSVLFLAETLYYFDEGSPSKCQISDFRFHQFCTLIGYFCWKHIKISAKRIQRSCVSWNWRLMQNLKKNWFVVSKLTRIWWILIRALKSLKNLHFDWSFTWKACNVWSKKVQRSYLSWH